MKRLQRFVLLTLLVGCVGCSQKANWSESEIFDRTDEQIELQYGMARMLERKKLFKEAREAYLEILDSSPDYGQALHRLAVISIRLDDLNKGIEYFEKAVASSDENAELLADYGYALFLTGDSAGAKLRLNSARDLDPSSQRVINNLAIVIGSDGQIDQSLELFRMVNSEANALCNIAFVLSQNGDHERAKSYFHRALDLNPKLKKAANGLIQIHQHEESGQERLTESELVESSLDSTSRESHIGRRGDVLNMVRESVRKKNSTATGKILKEDSTVMTQSVAPRNAD